MMDKEYYMNAGIPTPHPLEFETIMPIGWNGLNCSEEQSFLDPNSSVEQYSQFESALSSMVSSPAASSSGLSNDAFVLRELIGKLGGIGNSIAFPSAATTVVATGSSCNPANDSCYSTPLSSPPKLNLPILDHIKMPNLGNSVPLNPLPSFSTDPGFAERAAKFSCFGSWSFNGRASPFGMNNAELVHRSSSQLVGNGKLSRVSSSPSLKQDGSPIKNQNLSQPQMEMTPINQMVTGSDKKLSKLSDSFANSNEESSVSEQIPSAETGSKTSNELNSRKRKPISKGKPKEDGSTSAKGVNGDDDANAKRSKPTESGKVENNGAKTEEEAKGGSTDENDKQKTNQKPPEPPKDYIHVRARRGQATDSHSLAERVRREKISERMKLLQDLVPGCNKVTGKALMLDEIINYVQSLQRQVEFLSMKLASVNPGLDFNMENLLSKETFQQNATLPQQIYPLDSSTPAFLNHQPHQIPQLLHNNNASIRTFTQNLILDGFDFPEFGEGDLHSIFQMGFGQNPVNFPVPIPNQTSNMKIER